MRILALTDFHGTYAMVPKIAREAQRENVDAVVIAGDITNFGPVSVAAQIVRGLLVAGVPVLWIPGNCDPEEMAGHPNMPPHELHFKTLNIGSTLFTGIGGSTPSPFPGMLEYPEETIMTKAIKLTKKNEKITEIIFLTHVPPHGTTVDVIYSGEHVGSTALTQLVEMFEPAAVLCGHIHESRGVDRIGKTLIVNPGPAMNGLYAIVEKKGSSWHAELESTE